MGNSRNEWLEGGEQAARTAGVVAGVAVVGLASWRGIWRGLRRPGGRASGAARRVLRPGQLLGFSALWWGICVRLWRPLPLRLSPSARLAALLAGSAAYFSGLAFYLAGMRALGARFRVSSSLGAQLLAGQTLETRGLYAWVRHPMYLALQTAALGGLLLYRNWTAVFVALNLPWLILRARREEAALAAEFGQEWAAYTARVPFWWPRRPASTNALLDSPGKSG